MGREKITLDKFKEEVKNLTNNEYEVVGDELVNSKTPINIIHHECDNIYPVRRDDFLRGRRCPYCGKRKKKTTNEVKKELKDLVGTEYSISSEYISNTKPLYMIHECGHEFKTSYNRFFTNGSRCPKCMREKKNIRMTTEEYKELVYNMYGDEYSVIGEYVNKTTKILMRHNTCGHEWGIDPYHFIDEQNGCTICNKIAKEESKYIRMISNILDKENIIYEREKKLFRNPKTKMFLRADFFLEDYNLVIEYDGKQHFKPMFNDKEKLAKQQERDKIKNTLLKKKGINLLRIPYTISKKVDIEQTIKDYLKTISSQDSIIIE